MQIDFSKKLFKKVPLFLQCILLFDAMSFSLLIFIKMKKKRNRKLKIQISLKKDSALTKPLKLTESIKVKTDCY